MSSDIKKITDGQEWRPKYIHIVAMCLSAALIITNVFSFKVVELYGFKFGAGAILFPFCLILGDIMTELYGFKRARQIIVTALCLFFFYTLFSMIIVALPPAETWLFQDAMEKVFSFAPRVFVAGSLAYLAGELMNSYIMSVMKLYNDGKNFPFRAVLSTFFGELANSIVFFTIVLVGVLDAVTIIEVIINGTILKTVLEIIILPVTSKIVSKLKELEGVDFFDQKNSVLKVS